MLPYLDRDEGRSSKWKDFTKSIRTIDQNDPNQSGEKKLQEIYDKTCAYMKGKKSLRDDDDQQMRFDQALDVLSALGEAGPFAKLAANAVVDRINEVRLGHDSTYMEIKLEQYGIMGLSRHTHVPPAKPKAMDPLPAYHAFLEWVPKDKRYQVEPLPYVGEYVEALYSPKPITEAEATQAIAAAIAISRQQVYYFNSIKGEKLDKTLEAKIKLGGRAVIDTELLDVDAFQLTQDPAVIALGKKYTDPEARKELFRNGQLGLPSKIKQGKKIRWSDVEVGEYQKLSKADYWIRIVEGRAREPLASPDKDGKVPKHEMLDVVDQGKKGFRDAPRIDLSRLDAEFLKQAYQAAKDGRELHKNGEALRQDPGLGQMNV